MKNLLEETTKYIKEIGQELENIVFIGSEQTGHQCTLDEFKLLANKEYDNGYGGQEVANDLIIVFKDKTIMRRNEYDGTEWWEYEKPFVLPKEKKEIKTLFPENSWRPLSECN